MSMRDMVSAESCGVANPLANLANIAQGGQLPDSRNMGGMKPGMNQPGGMAEMMNAMQPAMMDPSQQEQFVQNFNQGPMPGMMRPEMLRPQNVGPNMGPDMAAEFAKMNMNNPDFEKYFQQHQGNPEWAMAFAHAQQQQQQQQQHTHMQQMAHQAGNEAWVNEFARPAGMVQQPMMHQPMMNNPMMMMNNPMNSMMMQNYTPQMQQQYTPTQFTAEAKVEAKVEIPQEEVKIEAPSMGMGMDKETVEALMKSDNPKWANSKFLKFIDKISKGEIELRDNQAIEVTPEAKVEQRGDEWAAEFDTEEAWMEKFGEEFKDVNPDAWAKQFEESMGSNAEEFLRQYGESKDFQDQDWAKALSDATAAEQKDPEYTFAEQNNYVDTDDPYAEGVRLLNEGKLRLAILAFEAATNKNPDNAEAWRYLGQAQAENENEQNAIAALLKCVSIDPYNLPALLMLGVSYTNDLEERRALNFLKTWMLNNPDYQGNEAITEHVQQVEEYEEMYGGNSGVGGFDGTLHEQVTKMFLKAAEVNPTDADTHTVLGVLYHISNQFEQAIGSFSNAVKCRPEDPTLWNKLGATQANSGNSKDACHAYTKALQLRPTYVRALANLAIAFANQGMHEDATRTYLATLKQNPGADHVWSYLRISLSNLGKADLVQLAEAKNVELFRQYYKF